MRNRARCAVMGVVAGTLLLTSAVPASAAAGPRASCVGSAFSHLASTGDFDVHYLKFVGRVFTGDDRFGKFVSGGARQQPRGLGNCLPPGL